MLSPPATSLNGVIRTFASPKCLDEARFKNQSFLKLCDRTDAVAKPSNVYYDKAIAALNSLQSNQESLRKGKTRPHTNENLEKVVKYLGRIGIQRHELDKLNSIHVAGTKGKGSSAAFIEGILRHSGKKTGMFTSPHLISVNERIKINGVPISQPLFAEYFWSVYNALKERQDDPDDMPSYFRMLTVMAFRIFLAENVDVAVIEVGVGGQYDCTNVLTSPKVCVITTLDYDHVTILGHTLPEIAWQKAGIMKPGVPCVVAAGQAENAMRVLHDRAAEIGSPVLIAPDFDLYHWSSGPPRLGIEGDIQRLNASVAIQASMLWDARTRRGISLEEENWKPGLFVDENVSKALGDCRLPGRAEIIQEGRVKFCLDGAHTPASIKACISWFSGVSPPNDRPRVQRDRRVLIFNCTGDRDPEELLNPLSSLFWDAVLFCPNVTNCKGNVRADMNNFRVSEADRLKKLERQATIWSRLHPNSADQVVSILPCICEALQEAKNVNDERSEVHVLITGSMHLVGGVLSVLNPELLPSKP